MGIALGIKRAWRVWKPSPRMWVRRNYLVLCAYATGLFTGLFHGATHAFFYKVIYSSFATFCVLIVLRWWSGWKPSDSAPTVNR